MGYSPPGYSVHGILQVWLLKWVAIPFSKGSSWPKVKPGSPTLQADSLLSEPPGRVLNKKLEAEVFIWRDFTTIRIQIHIVILLLNIKYHFRSGDSKQRSQGQIRMKPIFAKLALWAHSHSCLFRYCLWLLPCYNGVEYGNPLQHSCLEKSHGQRILAGYSPWDCKELDTTERLSFHFIFSCYKDKVE